MSNSTALVLMEITFQQKPRSYQLEVLCKADAGIHMVFRDSYPTKRDQQRMVAGHSRGSVRQWPPPPRLATVTQRHPQMQRWQFPMAPDNVAVNSNGGWAHVQMQGCTLRHLQVSSCLGCR
jgi:hypothetical protein